MECDKISNRERKQIFVIFNVQSAIIGCMTSKKNKLNTLLINMRFWIHFYALEVHLFTSCDIASELSFHLENLLFDFRSPITVEDR